MFQQLHTLRCPHCGSDRTASAFSNTCAACGREIRLGQKTVSPVTAGAVILAVVLGIVWAALFFG